MLLMQVVERHGKEFRETDVINAFTSMAKWKDSAGNTDVLHSKPFQTLVGTLPAPDVPLVCSKYTFVTLHMVLSICRHVLSADMVIMGLKRFSNSELTSVIKAAGTLQFDDDMLLDRTSQQLMLSVHKMSAEELYNLVCVIAVFSWIWPDVLMLV